MPPNSESLGTLSPVEPKLREVRPFPDESAADEDHYFRRNRGTSGQGKALIWPAEPVRAPVAPMLGSSEAGHELQLQRRGRGLSGNRGDRPANREGGSLDPP